jgi:hypothetical protein
VGLADEFVHRGAPFAGDPWVQIPRVSPDLTTSRVITLERIRGVKITDLTALEQAGLDRHAVADRTALIVAKMVFEDGFFHADPHPGNFFIEPTARVGIVDLGMVGSLDDHLREQLGRLLSGSCGGTRDGSRTPCSRSAARPRTSTAPACATTLPISSRAPSASLRGSWPSLTRTSVSPKPLRRTPAVTF